MDLSPEDALRINVLLAEELQAVRVDESSMTLYALSERGEAKVKLNPNCRDDPYLRRVRETLSSHVLGSPGGYPVYLKRWTRMGQARDEILESLLLLAEPEAVVAVVNAAGITDEIARRAWWASQTAENARCMLRQEDVVSGEMGKVLADFLVEFLPFEEEARDQIASVRLVLQGDLVDQAERDRLWARGKQRSAFYVGFLQALPDDLPLQQQAHPDRDAVEQGLEPLKASGNPFALQLSRLLGPNGQAFLEVVTNVLRKPANQDVVVEMLHAIAAWSGSLHFEERRPADIEHVAALAERMVAGNEPLPGQFAGWLSEVVGALPEYRDLTKAMVFVSLLDEPVVNPIFSRTDAVGTVMRKKLKPISEPLVEQIKILRGQA